MFIECIFYFIGVLYIDKKINAKDKCSVYTKKYYLLGYILQQCDDMMHSSVYSEMSPCNFNSDTNLCNNNNKKQWKARTNLTHRLHTLFIYANLTAGQTLPLQTP